MRPLISVRRSDIEQYVRDNGIPFVTDPSNSDLRYDRNWIRHELIPLLEERNSLADVNILKAAEIQAETYTLISDLAELDRKVCSKPDGNLDWSKVRGLGLARIKNLIMHICASRNLTDVSTHHVEEFARGLIAANLDSRNELRLREFKIKKVGKTLVIDHQ